MVDSEVTIAWTSRSSEEEPESEREVAPKEGRAGPVCQGDFRVSFLRKLSYQKVWLPRTLRPPSHSTVIIFDWDDTLLCTSFVSSRPACASPVGQRLQGVAQAARRLLEQAQRMGQTFIITNAMHAWVEHSARKYLPAILPALAGVKVISARDKFETCYPEKIGEWKVQAFLEVQHQLNLEAVTNLVSIGDSMFELDAALTVGKLFPRAIIKTVKFREAPSPEELLKELELVGQQLAKIVECGRRVQVSIERKSM